MTENRTIRIDWLDTAKGLGILLVVLGHNSAPDYLIRVIYAFHIPLFFFLSGYLVQGPDRTWTQHTARSFTRLIVPYLVFNVITYLYWILVDQPPQTYENHFRPLWGMLYGVGTDGWLLHNNALWFLTCLFIVDALFAAIQRVGKSGIPVAVMLVVCGLVGHYLPGLIDIRLPWGASTALVAVVFYGAGYFFKAATADRESHNNILIALSALAYVLIFSMLNSVGVDMNSSQYGNIFMFYAAAAAGIVLTISVARYLSSNYALAYLGKHSLLIFGLHIIAIKIFKNQLGIGLQPSLAESLICTFGEIALMLPFVAAVGVVKKHWNRAGLFRLSRARHSI